MRRQHWGSRKCRSAVVEAEQGGFLLLGTAGGYWALRRRVGVNYIMPLGGLGKGRGCLAQRHAGRDYCR